MDDLGSLRCALIAVTEDEKLAYHWERALHDLCEIFAATSLRELREYLEDYQPSLVLLDRHISGFEVKDIPQLLQISPSTKILTFSGSFDEEEAVACIKAGAKGYAVKNSDVFLLRKSIDVVRKGELWVPRYLVTRLLKEMQDIVKRERESAHTISRNHANPPSNPAKLNPLTRREQQIAELIGNGYSNKEIGSLLKISESTVKAHLSAIYHKLGLMDRLSLALFVTRHAAEPARVD